MPSIDTEELRYLLNRRKFLAGSAALAAVPLMPFHALAQAATQSGLKPELDDDRRGRLDAAATVAPAPDQGRPS